MNIAIVQFPGSNCERETMLAVERAGMTPIEFLWNQSPTTLQEMDGYIIVGGFSYEDRSRAGIIAALDPIMKEIKLQSEQGKPVLGICNGAQILVETGLVPGLDNHQLGMVLTDNKRMVDGKIWGTGFYNAWIHMKPNAKNTNNAFTRNLKQNVLTVPIAHAEGRFLMSDALLNEIQANGLDVFHYCDSQGEINPDFPINPNGSTANIAAVMNKAGNVMAMMPHPERTAAGDGIFMSMKEYIQEKNYTKPSFLSYTPNKDTISQFKQSPAKHELLVKLVITDNYALTVQNTLKQLGIPVTVTRMVHWHIDADSTDTSGAVKPTFRGLSAESMDPADKPRGVGFRMNCQQTLDKLKNTGLLFNERKEYLVPEKNLVQPGARAFLVQAKEDMVGQQKLQMLQDHFAIDGVNAIQHGILWLFNSEVAEMEQLIDSVLATNIIFNPNSHRCYQYE